jgi:hypothetical protein
VVDVEDKTGHCNNPSETERCLREIRAWYAVEKKLKPGVEIPEIDVRHEGVSFFDDIDTYSW